MQHYSKKGWILTDISAGLDIRNSISSGGNPDPWLANVPQRMAKLNETCCYIREGTGISVRIALYTLTKSGTCDKCDISKV